ncbi:MAG TPA: peptidoglycan-binding domain-containing protein [Pyrinomonadaceae bacterium]|jgi:N-acetylmuramoyl-L-alanine amidase
MKNLLPGSSGEDVRLLQQRLKDFGFYEGDTTGEFDEKTEAAVRYFQDNRQLAADGLVGLITLHELDLLRSASTDKQI